MKTMRFYRGTILVAGLLAGLALMTPEGLAQIPPQARKATRSASAPGTPAGTPAAQGAPEAATARERVVIKKIEGIGTAARIKTPEYTVIVNDNNNPVIRDWARIQARFETEADWTDELVFHYYVQVRNPKTNKDMLFTGDFTYLDIPKGKNHLSTAFLRPTTLERYGDIVGIALEIEAKGEKVAVASLPESPSGWWLLSKATKAPGVLLERSQTPFAFVAYDAYVTVKPR